MDMKAFEDWLRVQSVSSDRKSQAEFETDRFNFWAGRAEAFLIAADVLKSGALPTPVE